MRLHVSTAPGLLRRVLLPLTAALLIGGGLAAPAAAAPATPAAPAAPLVTPSTTGPVAIGTPVTMAVSPGSPADSVSGYAWAWDSSLPVFNTVPSCGSGDAGRIHFVCGSTVTLRVSPPEPPYSTFSVWALDASGTFSAPRTIDVWITSGVEALHPVTHQWTTGTDWTVPPTADCGPGRLTVACLPDTAGVTTMRPNGARPLLLPPGVTRDGSDGALTFGPGNRLPAGTLGSVVDSRQSFTAGGLLSFTTTGTPATAIAQTGPGGAGFELGVTADGRWQFRVRSASGTAVVTVPNPTSADIPVYVAGVADAVNRELRLYVNGGLAAVAGFAPARGASPDGPVTVGGRPAVTGLTRPWVGQVGNPVVAQAPLYGTAISRLAAGSFFDTGGGID